MQTPSWYWNRLRLMSPGEIAWRVEQALRERLSPPRTAAAPPADAARVRVRAWPPPAAVDAAAFVEAADRVVAGTVRLFGTPVRIAQSPGCWNRDPVSGVTAPAAIGTRIDYRDASVVGNARNIWELNRHYQLVTLGQAWALTRDGRYRDALCAQLASWLRECPHPLGINWVSALEHGIRLINWALASRFGQLWEGNEEPVAGWRDSIYWHCRFIWEHRSRYSSANNHLIGEMAGLYVAATLWPCWSESARWRAEARRLLVSELERQTHPDGVTREQTVGYQMFVVQLALVAGLIGEEADDPFPREYWACLQRMIGFLRAIVDVGGNLPQFGDSDDGVAYTLTIDALDRRLPDLIDIDDAFSSDAPSDAPAAGGAAWLLSGFRRPRFWPQSPPPVPASFRDGGYHRLAYRSGCHDEVRLVFDAAPLGYLSIAAHGHADCLSLVLSIAGEELLVDPGTYCYHSDARWRNHFRSTVAHNTVTIDGVDQSVIAGPFMWLQRATPELIECVTDPAGGRVVAQHDGYRRLRDPVVHERMVELDGAGRRLVVEDRIRCSGPHRVERSWQLPEWAVVEPLDAQTMVVTGRRVRLVVRSRAAEQVATTRGDESRPAGWVSRKFGERVAAPIIVAGNHIRGAATLVTEFTWELLTP